MTENKEIWLIPYAHLDTQWRWEYPTTIKKYIKNTLDENLYLFENYPDYVFNFTGAIRYAMMKEYYPEKFAQIKPYVKNGKWSLAGTCLDETDTLAPSVESMIRNILYGDRWAKEEFGVSSRDYMIPDCFGFPANMPSVLAHCGIHGFSSQKLTWGSAVGIPFEIGVWKGPDGNGIVSALNPGSYNWRMMPPLHKSEKRLAKLNKLGEETGIWKSFQYFGVGDIGGAPTKGSVERAIESVENASEVDPNLKIKQGSSDEFFGALTDDEKEKLPTYEGDLLLVNHSAGSLTSAAIMKRWNRKNEQMATAAEVAAVTALWKAGQPYPSDKIKSAWYRTIGNQMHDILPGTCTPIAYEYSQNDEVVALLTSNAVLEDSAQAIAPYVKGNGEIMIFNPVGEMRQDPVDVILPEWDEKQDEDIKAVDADGNSLPVQIRKDSDNRVVATFIPELKPFSWTRYTLKEDTDNLTDQLDEPVTIQRENGSILLENANYQVKISNNGKISSIIDKKSTKEILKKPLAYEFQEEKPTAYPAWNMDWADRKKPPYLRIEDGGEVSVLEEGPLRCTVQIKIKLNKSVFVKEVSLAKDSQIIDFTERIHWRGKKCSLKLALTVDLKDPKATFNWETSRKERGINHEKLFEMPSRYWVDMSDKDRGVSLIEDSKYGYDRPNKETIRLTLLYTPAVRLYMGFKDQKWQDWGEHTIRYGLYAHDGGYKGTDHQAKLFNQKNRSFYISDEAANKTKSDISLLNISSEQVGILALKKAEDSDDLVLRIYERYGTPVEADIAFNMEISSVQEINGLEEPLQDIQTAGSKFTIKMEPNDIRSYLISVDGMNKQNDTKYQSIELPYNTNVFSSNMEQGGLFPAEMVPTKIDAGSIEYELRPENDLNAVKCNGQKIAIPEENNTISMLLGSESDTNSIVKWLDKDGNVVKTENLQVGCMTGYLGQWDTRKWLWKPKRYKKYKRDYIWLNICTGIKPGYIKRNRLEFYTNHTHKDGQDQYYKYGYMFSAILDVPNDAITLMLPENKSVNILAITVSKQPAKVVSAYHLNDKYDC